MLYDTYMSEKVCSSYAEGNRYQMRNAEPNGGHGRNGGERKRQPLEQRKWCRQWSDVVWINLLVCGIIS